MKPSLSHFKEFLATKGVTVKDIRYLGPGHRLLAIGFDAETKAVKVEVEPQYPCGYIVSFTYSDTDHSHCPFHWSMHYSPRKDGYQPTLTKPLKTLKSDICEFFKIPSK